MASNTSYTKNVNVERRTWDKEKYATLAAARAATEVDVDDPAYEKEQRLKKLKEEQGDGGPQYFKVASEEEKKVTGSERAYLKARTAKVDGIGETNRKDERDMGRPNGRKKTFDSAIRVTRQSTAHPTRSFCSKL